MNTTDNPLIQAMQQPAFYNHPVDSVELIETHISWVLLTGPYAYKIKKPVDFGFLDFSTLAKRKYYCEEELRLNGRLAPDIYLDVIAIAETNGTYAISPHDDAIIEYAVKMKQFPQQGLIRNLLQHKLINIVHIQQLADAIASFHNNIAVADAGMVHGNPEEVIKPVEHNFIILENFITDNHQRQELEDIKRRSMELYEQLRQTFSLRKQNGFIRECHGDLHLGNIAFIEDKALIFDGIEFSESLRWIDVNSEIAFLVMDMEDIGEHYFAAALLNRYLEKTGDYDGMTVMRFYKIYRAMVRAKVTALRLQQETESPERSASDLLKLGDYLRLALTYCAPPRPFMIITHGISGSGKSWIGNQLAAQLDAIIIHSDHERKRLFAATADNLYSHDITVKTYNHLKTTARQLINAGYPVIADATFLDKSYRHAFRQMAKHLGVPFYILHCQADLNLLKQRIEQRSQEKKDMSDADVKVMTNQFDNYRPLEQSEMEHTVEFDSSMPPDLILFAEKFKG